jgi:hypothetical protein
MKKPSKDDQSRPNLAFKSFRVEPLPSDGGGHTFESCRVRRSQRTALIWIRLRRLVTTTVGFGHGLEHVAESAARGCLAFGLSIHPLNRRRLETWTSPQSSFLVVLPWLLLARKCHINNFCRLLSSGPMIPTTSIVNSTQSPSADGN